MSRLLRVTCSVSEKDTVNGRMGKSDSGRMTANNWMSEEDWKWESVWVGKWVAQMLCQVQLSVGQ